MTRELAEWLQEFIRDKGRPPKRLEFTFHASDEDADSICKFMKSCVESPDIALAISQASVVLLFVGEISDEMAQATHARILSQKF